MCPSCVWASTKNNIWMRKCFTARMQWKPPREYRIMLTMFAFHKNNELHNRSDLFWIHNCNKIVFASAWPRCCSSYRHPLLIYLFFPHKSSHPCELWCLHPLLIIESLKSYSFFSPCISLINRVETFNFCCCVCVKYLNVIVYKGEKTRRDFLIIYF